MGVCSEVGYPALFWMAGRTDLDTELSADGPHANSIVFVEAVRYRSLSEPVLASPDENSEPGDLILTPTLSQEANGARRVLRNVGSYLLKPFRHAGRFLRGAGRFFHRKILAAPSRALWRRRLTTMINQLAAQMRLKLKPKLDVESTCVSVAPYLKQIYSTSSLQEGQSPERSMLVKTLLPQGRNVHFMSLVTKDAIAAQRGDFASFSSYGSVLFTLKDQSESPFTLLEALPIATRSSQASATEKQEITQAMEMIKTAALSSETGVLVDLLRLKNVSGVWCPRGSVGAGFVPNVFMRRLPYTTLREVLNNMAADSADVETRLYQLRVCLTNQVYKVKSKTSENFPRRGSISVDTLLVTADGSVHLPPPQTLSTLAVPSSAATGLEASTQMKSPGSFSPEEEEDLSTSETETPLSDDVLFAIVFAQIWCSASSLDAVAQEVRIHHRLKRELPEEFFSACPAMPDRVKILVIEGAF
ncbi:hypothetical protein BESB_025200 [Besnoitia besnoiti]|uniref:Uncharacterized protein n=1 Tax=Besnoitia besnoiti TaxID=94643 RepID=A0A2A9M2W0_BESBE|nr:uncharacterized protein BESB_025200 [Besnoitia besnoiti]PFH31554.1 hypothetical protein BESB_025200 [Besnoitia besnoiti]